MHIFFNNKGTGLFIFALFLLSSCYTETKTETDAVVSKNISRTVYSSSAAEPKSLNPISYSTAYELPVFQMIFQPLIYTDIQSGKIVPIITKSLPLTEEIMEGEHKGGMSYTFELKDNAKWDNGQPVTVDDVEFTLKTTFSPNMNSPQISHYLNDVVAVKRYEESLKKFTIISKKKHILGVEINSLIHVLPEYIYDENKVLRNFSFEELSDKEKHGELAEKHPELVEFVAKMNSPVFQREVMKGSGPYNLNEWIPGQRLVMTKKKDWWGEAYKGQNSYFANNPDTLFIRIIQDQNAKLVSLKNEELDVMSSIDSQDFLEISKDERMNELFNFYTPETYIFYFLYLNTKSKKLQDKNVRRALAHLVDVEEIIKNLYSGMATPVNGPFSSRKDYYNKALPLIKYDLEKARQLLKDAGWEDTNNNGTIDKVIEGKLTEMVLNAPFTETKYSVNLASYLKESFQDAGVKLETQILELNAQRQLLGKREFDLASGALGGNPFLDDFTGAYHTSADNPRGANRSGFGNAETDAILEEITTTFDKTKRDSLYTRFQEILYEEQALIFMFSPLERIAIHKRLKGKASGIRPYVQPESLGFLDVAE